jgi:hypothetical protein
MSSLVQLGPQYFPRVNTSNAVGAGSLYIGNPDTDPVVPINRKQVKALQESGILVEISQPISLSAGGMPLYEGSPVALYVEGAYSLTVLDINGALIYYVPFTPDVLFEGGVIVGDIYATGSITSDEWPENNNIAQFDGAKGIEDSGEPMTNVGLLDEAKEWTQLQNFDESTITSLNNAVAWNLNIAQCAVHTLTENTTISEPTNMKAGGSCVLRVVQAVGVYSLAWDASFDWGHSNPPSEPAADGDVATFSFYTDGSIMYSAEFNRSEA